MTSMPVTDNPAETLPKSSTAAPSREATRNRMRGNKSRDTKPELALRSELHRLGMRYRIQASPLPDIRRRADIVFPKQKVAVFVDGCFWHGCKLHKSLPKSNVDYWREKIERNRKRDLDTDNRLKGEGWRSTRVWEHEDPVNAAKAIATTVRDVRSSSSLT